MNELKTLIDLSAGTRLPQYEEEIFSNKKLTEYYLRKLCEQYDWYDHEDSVPALVYWYAKFVVGCRWPAAEAVIATDPEYAYYYARDVMKCRWPEAEHLITTDPQCAYRYARYVMKCRWSEAEAIIATDPQCAYCYAVNVMKSRWPEAEPLISTDRNYRRWYNTQFGTII